MMRRLCGNQSYGPGASECDRYGCRHTQIPLQIPLHIPQPAYHRPQTDNSDIKCQEFPSTRIPTPQPACVVLIWPISSCRLTAFRPPQTTALCKVCASRQVGRTAGECRQVGDVVRKLDLGDARVVVRVRQVRGEG
jgi:hypothetical protein